MQNQCAMVAVEDQVFSASAHRGDCAAGKLSRQFARNFPTQIMVADNRGFDAFTSQRGVKSTASDFDFWKLRHLACKRRFLVEKMMRDEKFRHSAREELMTARIRLSVNNRIPDVARFALPLANVVE